VSPYLPLSLQNNMIKWLAYEFSFILLDHNAFELYDETDSLFLTLLKKITLSSAHIDMLNQVNSN
jgi:hypothetical protein